MQKIYDKARVLMKGQCRVCKVCDGRVCAGEVPGMGGLNTGAAFRNNISSLAALKLNMRLPHSAAEPDTKCHVLGYELDMPVLAAPIGGVSFNMGGAISEEDYIDAIVSGSKSAGVIGCTGDGVPPFIHEAAFAALKKNDGHGIPFIKPWEGHELEEKLEKARATGCSTFGMDVDAAGLITLRQMGRPVSPKTPRELEKIVSCVHDWEARFVLKGVMTPDEALLAAEVGVDAIIVSNHGGRVLDHAPGAAEVLPKIADVVGNKMEILADGGVRDGYDVLKLLALGANAVLIGRPLSVMAIGGLQDGVEKYFASIKGQLTQAMVLTGSQTIKGIDSRVIFEN